MHPEDYPDSDFAVAPLIAVAVFIVIILRSVLVMALAMSVAVTIPVALGKGRWHKDHHQPAHYREKKSFLHEITPDKHIASQQHYS